MLIAASEYDVLKLYELVVAPAATTGTETATFTFLKAKGEMKKFSKERGVSMSYLEDKRLLLILSNLDHI